MAHVLNSEQRRDLIRSILAPGTLTRGLGGLLTSSPCTIKDILNSLGGDVIELGKGRYGKAYEVCPNRPCTTANSIIFKETSFSGASDNPAMSLNAEIRILQTLQSFLINNITPHIPYLISDFLCTPPGKELQRYIVMERGHLTLHDWITRQKTIPVAIFRVLCFQWLWTLAVIQEYYPSFRHNDLHAQNVLLLPGPTTGYTCYIWNETRYYVPNVGLILILADFGLSTIFPSIPNYDAVNISVMNVGVGIETNRYVDTCKLLYYFYYHHKVTREDPEYPAFRAFVDFGFPPAMLQDRPRWFEYAEPRIEVEYRLPRDLLNHEFFNSFRTPQTNITDTYNKNNTGASLTTGSVYLGGLRLNPKCVDYNVGYLRPVNPAWVDPARAACPKTVVAVEKLNLKLNRIKQWDRLPKAFQEALVTRSTDLVRELSAHLPLVDNPALSDVVLNIVSYHMLGFYLIDSITKGYEDYYIQLLTIIYNTPLLAKLRSLTLSLDQCLAIVRPILIPLP